MARQNIQRDFWNGLDRVLRREDHVHPVLYGANDLDIRLHEIAAHDPEINLFGAHEAEHPARDEVLQHEGDPRVDLSKSCDLIGKDTSCHGWQGRYPDVWPRSGYARCSPRPSASPSCP